MPFVDLERGWTGKVARIQRDDSGRIVQIVTRLDQTIDGKSWAVFDMRQAERKLDVTETT